VVVQVVKIIHSDLVDLVLDQEVLVTLHHNQSNLVMMVVLLGALELTVVAVVALVPRVLMVIMMVAVMVVLVFKSKLD
tara:strand:+ start:272 stop:505 length:234 start_codon:yes stop_codon:yes gene_type:complete